jgi:aspartate aminotransferase
MSVIDLKPTLSSVANESLQSRGIATMAQELIASEILKIAGEIRTFVTQGAEVLNLTVGDFASKEFPVPEALARGIREAIEEGHTNYPPSSGVIECREAVREMFRDRLGLDYPLSSVLIAGGARPMIAGTFFTLVNPGDAVIYSVPSWNNNHYCTLTRATPIEIDASRENDFFPRAQDIAPHLSRARLVCLNTPQNPTGTIMPKGELEALARSIVNENARRKSAGVPALYLMFDQVYWMLTAEGRVHTTPVELVPEVAPYTIFVDGISKSFAATGLRVGWAVGPSDVMERMGAILTHVGAWAPRPEQVATAKLLRDPKAVDAYLATMRREVFARLDLLASAVGALRRDGFPVDAIAPAGAIYLSLKVDIAGKTGPDGKRIESDEDIRTFLLKHAGWAVVPFGAFGVRGESRWFRASVGAVSRRDLERGAERLRSALALLR